MTDPRDALLTEAARLLTVVAHGSTASTFIAERWLARYEAERAGRGENDAEEIEPGVFVKRSVKSAFADIRAARTAPATPGKDGGE